MDEALPIRSPRQRKLAFRDGLLVAVLASRAPRLRTLATPQIGVQFVTAGDRFRLKFGTADLTRKTRLEYDLPAGLADYIAQTDISFGQEFRPAAHLRLRPGFHHRSDHREPEPGERMC
jgi:hypothetical protein